MLEQQFLKSLSIKNQVNEINIYREYCQHLFLSYFYKQKGSEIFLFKGGTALRIIFQSPRYSEDLDFSASSISNIDHLLLDTIGALDQEGLVAENIIENKETGGGYLSILDFSAPLFKSRIKLNIQRKDGTLLSNSKLVSNEFIAPYTIVYLKDEVLIAEKIQAFLHREMPKERDFFDLYFILNDNSLRNLVQKDVNLKQAILERLESLDDRQLKIGIKDFLPISYHNLFTGDNFKAQIRKLVEAYL